MNQNFLDRATDKLLDEADFLERGIHGYFPFPRKVSLSPRDRGEQYDDDLDAMIDEALQSMAGGSRGRAPRGISPWLGLFNRAIQSIHNAINSLRNPTNARNFNNALTRSETLLNQAGAEVRRVMSGSRRNRVLDQLSNALIRIQAARAQAQGSSLIGRGRSLLSPEISLQGAIAHIQAARAAVGLRSV